MAKILNVKDSQRLEVLRQYVEADPAFFDTLNRPHVDMEQRTKDLDRIFTPARGFRVRQEIPVSDSVEVEIGIIVSSDGTTINQTTLQTIGPVTPTAGGQIRADLIYFNLDTEVAVRLAGVPVASGSGFSPALWPDLPAIAGAIPLGILYVGENIGVTVDFDETLTGAVEGEIIDIRPAIGTSRPIFEDVAANILTDVASGAAGSSGKVARADHRHPLTVDAFDPAVLAAGATPTPGGIDAYARRDHRHDILVELAAGALRQDGTASAGSAGQFVRSDHIHPLNVALAGLPAPLSALLAATLGSAVDYSRTDHRHALPAFQTSIVQQNWVASSTSRNFVFGFGPSIIIAIGGFAATSPNNGVSPSAFVGFANLDIAQAIVQMSVGWLLTAGGGDINLDGMGMSNTRIGYVPAHFTQPDGTGTNASVATFNVTNFGSSTTILPTTTVTGSIMLIAVAMG